MKLNVAHEAATAYLNVLRAETFKRIQKNDLDLTRSNLELARVRQQIGMSGPAEIYRWESQMATARNAGIQANTQRNVAQIALNRILHRPLEEDFDTQEIGLHDENLITHDPRFIRFIDNKHNFGIFRNLHGGRRHGVGARAEGPGRGHRSPVARPDHGTAGTLSAHRRPEGRRDAAHFPGR